MEWVFEFCFKKGDDRLFYHRIPQRHAQVESQAKTLFHAFMPRGQVKVSMLTLLPPDIARSCTKKGSFNGHI